MEVDDSIDAVLIMPNDAFTTSKCFASTISTAIGSSVGENFRLEVPISTSLAAPYVVGATSEYGS